MIYFGEGIAKTIKVEKREGTTIVIAEEKLFSLDKPKLRDVVKKLAQ